MAALAGPIGHASAAEATGTIRYYDQTGAQSCLDSPSYANGASGTQVILWDCHGDTSQQWEFIREADGNTPFEPDHTGVLRISGKCLDAFGGSTAPGTPIILWDCHGGANQRWTYYGLNGAIALAGQGGNACLVISSGSTPVNGTKLVIAPCAQRTGIWDLDAALLSGG